MFAGRYVVEQTAAVLTHVNALRAALRHKHNLAGLTDGGKPWPFVISSC
jgi:hypothetical protein